MTQKVIKVGDSAAVIIPKKSLKELNLRIGDEVVVDVRLEIKSIFVYPLAVWLKKHSSKL